MTNIELYKRRNARVVNDWLIGMRNHDKRVLGVVIAHVPGEGRPGWPLCCLRQDKRRISRQLDCLGRISERRARSGGFEDRSGEPSSSLD